MKEELISQLRQMDKETLIQQNLSLQLELEVLRSQSEKDGSSTNDTSPPSPINGEIFKIFTDKLSSLIFTYNTSGRLTYTNQACAKLTGYTQQELLNMNIFEIIHEDYHEEIMERSKARFRGEGPVEVNDIRLVKKDGSICWVEVFGVKIEGLTGSDSPFLLCSAIDITARVETALAIRQNEEMFRLFADNIQVAVYVFGKNGNIIYINPFASLLTGYPKNKLMSMTIFEMVHHDHRQMVIEWIRKRFSGEPSPDHYDIKLQVKDGSIRWVELHLKRLELWGQKIILGTAIDIKARKKSEEKFRSLFERSSDPMLLLDKEGFFNCNQAALKKLKAGSIQEIKAHPSRLSPPRQPDGRLSSEKATDMIAHAYTTGFHRFEWLHCDLEGHEFWADVSLTAIPFENRKIIFTVWRDISAIKELEQLLREEREQLMVTLRSIGDAVITTNLAGQIILMNRVAEQLTGWKQKEARGRKIEEILDIVEDRTGKRAMNPLELAINHGTVLELEEDTILRSRDGRQFKIADSASPIRDEKSNIIGGVLVFRDITNRERMQEEVLKLRKLESVGRLAGGIAHDFNNLLTGIIGNIEVAAQQLDPQTESVRKNLEKALKASLRAADLTQKLLTFAKGGEPIKKTTAINEIIKDSAEFSLLGSKIALTYNIPDDLWAAEVDAGQISQVIQNLIINAVQAMPAGGIITLRAENVDLSALQTATLPLKPGLYVKISVRDQGCGIAEELRDKIFDPFFTTREDGSGLGLSVIHSIVTKHDGYIDVQSKPGDFAEFTVFLPALGKILQNENTSALTRKTMSTTGHILVMDDEEFIREILAELLTNLGYEVTTVNNGQQAIEAYQQQKFELIIMDLTIPGGLGGLETIQLLKEVDPGVKAVVSSGYANDPVVAEYEQYGFCGYLNKPYNIRDLSDLLEKILPKHDGRL